MSQVKQCSDCKELPIIEKVDSGWSVACECYDPSPVNYDDPPPVTHSVLDLTRDMAVEMWNDSYGMIDESIRGLG